MIRIFIIILILSTVLFAYPVWRLGTWLHLSTATNLAITVPLFLSQFIARFGLRHRKGPLVYIIRGAADFFLGLSPIIFGEVLLAELCLLLFDWPSANVAIAIIISTAIIGIWGVTQAWHPKVVAVPLSSDRLYRPVRFVQISDVHIGSRTSRYLDKIIDSVIDLSPEFLCITGDLVDQRGVTEDKLRSLKRYSGPIYYCTGNHEYYEDLEEILERLKNLGVEVLRSRSVEFDGLQVIGIDDNSDPQQVARILPSIDVLDDHYSILLYHRPHGLEDAHRHGIDLKLSGHTHNGQIMPFHLAVNKVFKYTRGLYQYENTYLYVNEGSGTWGPTLRLGTRSEITLFELSPMRQAA